MRCPPRYLTRLRRARFVPRFVPASRDYLIRRYVETTLEYFQA